MYDTLYAGAAEPGAARLDANARAQAFSAVFSGDALEATGTSAAIEASRRANCRDFMVVFLDGQKYQHPAWTIDSTYGADKRENSSVIVISLTCVNFAIPGDLSSDLWSTSPVYVTCLCDLWSTSPVYVTCLCDLSM